MGCRRIQPHPSSSPAVPPPPPPHPSLNGRRPGDSQAALPDELFMEDGDGEDEAMED